jgi:hypothetical protein
MWFYRDPAVGTLITAFGVSLALVALGVPAYGTAHRLLGVTLFTGGGIFFVIAAFGVILLVWERWGGGSPLASMLPKNWRARLRKEAIEVWHVPDPDRQNYVHLHVKNNRRTDSFIAQVLGVRGAEEPQTVPWSVKWRGDDAEERRIVGGTEQILDLAQLSPPAPHPHIKDACQRGEFRFFSTSKLDGWVVHAGPSEVVGPLRAIREALEKRDYFDEALSLKVKVTTSQAGHTATKKVDLGFNRPFTEHQTDDGRLTVEYVNEPIRVGIEDWPPDR